MSMQMNKEWYLKLVKEDIEWLLKNTERDLERDHIIAIIKGSILHHYPQKEYCDEEFIKWWEDNVGVWEYSFKSVQTPKISNIKKEYTDEEIYYFENGANFSYDEWLEAGKRLYPEFNEKDFDITEYEMLRGDWDYTR